jgi:serine/threonine protein kinase/Tol biopolymer transport system component
MARRDTRADITRLQGTNTDRRVIRREAPEQVDEAEQGAHSAPEHGRQGRATAAIAVSWASVTDIPAQIGPYQVVREIGRGGMGVVYLARDTKLDRDVAIKALPDDWAADADRLARFEREARSLAQLNHPNIAGIYGVEEQNDRRFLILEYVEGETLADRLGAGPIPADEVLELAVEIAAGVEAAHEAGVVHRDLKPDNIKVTPDGKVKVLDFGLAKADQVICGTASADAPTVTTPRSPTIPGAILGTAPYMSPEQARGRPVDKRTDIWSYGVILYEMLTGINPFVGETVSDSIGAVIHKEVDLERLPPDLPPMVRHVIRRCIRRDLATRYRDIGDVRVDLDASSESFDNNAAASVTGRSRILAIGLVTFGLVAGSVLTLVAARFVLPFDAAPSVQLRLERFEVPVLGLEEKAVLGRSAVLAPDGSAVAYRAAGSLWVRPLDSFAPIQIDQSEGAVTPFWSPDSRWIGFARGLELWKASASGARAQRIGPIPEEMSTVNNATWREDGQIIFGTNTGSIYEISSFGGSWVEILGPPAGVNDFHSIEALPNGQALLVTVHSDSDLEPHRLGVWDGSALRVYRDLGPTDMHVGYGVYSPTGHILFEQHGPNAGIWAVPFSVSRLEISGPPFLVASGGGSPSVDDHGTLAYTRGGAQNVLTLDWVDPETGQQTPLHGEASEWLSFPCISPDGASVAYVSHVTPGRGVWIENLDTGDRQRVTLGDMIHLWPAWSPDGRRIAAVERDRDRSQHSRVVFYATDGSGPVGDSIENADNPGFDGTWSTMVFQRSQDDTGLDIFSIAMDGGGEPTPIITASGAQYDARLSPDGKWLAYTSEESGDPRLYLTRFPSAEGQWEVSDGFGERAQWSADGEQLYFLGTRGVLYVVDVNLETSVRFDRARPVINNRSASLNPYRGCAFDPRSNRILVARRATQASEYPSIAIIKNWAAEFDNR